MDVLTAPKTYSRFGEKGCPQADFQRFWFVWMIVGERDYLKPDGIWVESVGLMLGQKNRREGGLYP
jgi:hypothetical protein